MNSEISILLADDEPDFLDELRLYFERRGYGVIAVTDGDQALAYLRKGGVDVAILDLVMPRHSGLEVAEISRDEGHDTGLILLTNFGDLDEAIRAINSHVDYWIEKPKLELDDLRIKVDRLAGGVPIDTVRRILGKPPKDEEVA